MYEKVETCPLCEADQYSNFMICKDHMVSGESFALTQCKNCGFIFTNPRPSSENASKYYESPEYISHNDKPRSLFQLSYSVLRTYSNNRKNRIIRSYVENGRLLDIGCGTGSFLKAMKSNGWEIQGVESNNTAKSLAVKQLGIDIFDSLLDIPPKKTYNAITLWHVLEHLYDINESLDHIKKLKAKKGRIFIALPNYESPDSQYYK
jgi:SAM-dependent methyltransferase